MKKIKMYGQGQVVEDGIVRDWGRDAEGIEYTVDFEVLDNFDVNAEPDLSNACDWNSPIEVWCDGEEIDINTVELEY